MNAMNELPLVSGRGLDDTLAWNACGAVSVGRYCADVQALGAWLPAGQWVINLCEDRYHYAVLLGACAISGRTSLQPASQSAQVLQQLMLTHPGCFAVTDSGAAAAALPFGVLRMPVLPALDGPGVTQVPCIPVDHTVAILFTSGSTGQPTAHAKNWGKLVANGRAEAQALGLVGRPHALIGTVPAQHSYGFESTFLLALHGGCSFWSGKPFYPQDLADALALVPQPRMVVTTPFHLGSFMASAVALPSVDLWLSATAALSPQLAAQVEAATGAPVYEIYGSTESSQLATRRTLEGPAWTPMPGTCLDQVDAITWASGTHVQGRVALSDLIELLPDGRFLLQGRHADMINLAGKRTSLAYLNHQLCGIEGVRDAAFFLPHEDSVGRVGRLVAFAVAPGCTPESLMTALRRCIDPVFLPRPLVLVEALPRNGTGKLARQTLEQLYGQWVPIHGRDAG